MPIRIFITFKTQGRTCFLFLVHRHAVSSEGFLCTVFVLSPTLQLPPWANSCILNVTTSSFWDREPALRKQHVTEGRWLQVWNIFTVKLETENCLCFSQYTNVLKPVLVPTFPLWAALGAALFKTGSKGSFTIVKPATTIWWIQGVEYRQIIGKVTHFWSSMTFLH